MKIIFFGDNKDDIIKKIKEGNYDFFSAKSFFAGDAVRLIKFLNILISFILYLLYIISYLKIKCIKKIRKKNSFSFILIINLLTENFLHTFSFLLNWMRFVKEDFFEFGENNKSYHIGGLLIGNPSNGMAMCKIQGFLMIYSALSQDFLINIFFYIINSEKIPKKFGLKMMLIIFSFLIPLIFSFIYFITDNIGINERYCHIKKFYFDNSDNAYHFNNNFVILIVILYLFRGINLVISCIFLYKIIKYIKQDDFNKIYIIRIVIILVTQILSITLEIINTICEQSVGYNSKYIISDIFLCINTLDGIIFPLICSLSNSTYTNLFCMKERTETMMTEEDFNNYETPDSSAKIYEKVTNEKKRFSLAQCIDSNNFDISF